MALKQALIYLFIFLITYNVHDIYQLIKVFNNLNCVLFILLIIHKFKLKFWPNLLIKIPVYKTLVIQTFHYFYFSLDICIFQI